jgi:hypothetical protein
MSRVAVERTVRIHGDADNVIELIDHWQDGDWLGIRFGAHDGEGGISWSGEEHSPIDPDMALALAKALMELAGDAA